MNEVVLNELPENWAWTKLGDVVTKIIGGGTPSKNKPQYWEGDIPWLTVKDMRSRRPADAMDHISEKAVKESSTNIIPEDTVIIATRIGLGKVIRVPYKAAINQDLKALILPPEIEKGYLEYWFVSKTNYLESIGSGTTVKGIRLEQVRDLDFPLAPPEQQKRIVAKIEELFSHIDAGIEALKKAKQLLKQYRQSVLKAAVTGELTKEWREANKNKLEPASQLLERILKERRQKWEEQQLEQFRAKGKMPKDDKWKVKYKEPAGPDLKRIHDLPNTWRWSTYDQISDRVTVGHVGSMKNEYIDDGIPFLRSQNVRENRYDPKGLKFVSLEFHEQLKKSSLEPGDIVTVRSGSVGVSCVIPEHLKVSNCSDLVIVKQPKAVIPKLAAYYMNTITQTKVAAEKVGVALTHFNTKSMAEMPLPVPPLEEQLKIVELVDQKLSDVEKLDAVIEEQLIKAEKNKQAVLASAFSGGLH